MFVMLIAHWLYVIAGLIEMVGKRTGNCEDASEREDTFDELGSSPHQSLARSETFDSLADPKHELKVYKIDINKDSIARNLNSEPPTPNVSQTYSSNLPHSGQKDDSSFQLPVCVHDPSTDSTRSRSAGLGQNTFQASTLADTGEGCGSRLCWCGDTSWPKLWSPKRSRLLLGMNLNDLDVKVSHLWIQHWDKSKKDDFYGAIRAGSTRG